MGKKVWKKTTTQKIPSYQKNPQEDKKYKITDPQKQEEQVMTLLIIGAGGYGRLVKEIAELNGYTCDFLDDFSVDAVGRIEEVGEIEDRYDGAIVAIGNVEVREKIKIKKPVTLIHPRAEVSKSAVVEDGCVIEAGAVVSTEAVVGRCSFICAGAVVNHNAVVGEYCQIDCNTVVKAGVVVNRGVKVDSCTTYQLHQE